MCVCMYLVIFNRRQLYIMRLLCIFMYIVNTTHCAYYIFNVFTYNLMNIYELPMLFESSCKNGY